MRIGIDIDGVLTDIEKWELDKASKFYYEKYNLQIVNPKGYETNEIFNVDEKYDIAFWNEYFREYSINVKARDYASEVINKLIEENNEIYIITARGNFLSDSINLMTNEENEEIVVNWLKNNNINYNKIIFSPEDKLKICSDNNIDLMIEDKPKNINEISSIIPVICFNAGYNESCFGNNIIRCYSWYDVYSKIKEINI